MENQQIVVIQHLVIDYLWIVLFFSSLHPQPLRPFIKLFRTRKALRLN